MNAWKQIPEAALWFLTEVFGLQPVQKGIHQCVDVYEAGEVIFHYVTLRYDVLVVAGYQPSVTSLHKNTYHAVLQF